jgi:hypothetical protein
MDLGQVRFVAVVGRTLSADGTLSTCSAMIRLWLQAVNINWRQQFVSD